MKNIFIIQNTSGTERRVLKRIGAQLDKNTYGFIVECHAWSFKLNRFKRPKIIKFEFFGDALRFVNFNGSGDI